MMVAEVQEARIFVCNPCNIRYTFVTGDWSSDCPRCKKAMVPGGMATVERLGNT